MSRTLALPFVLVLGCGPGSVSGGDSDDETGEPESCSTIEETVAALEAPELCESYVQDFPSNAEHPTFGQPPREFDVEIVNDRDQPILLVDQGSGCKHPPRWFLLDGEHEGRAIWLPPSNCRWDWPACGTFVDDDGVCLLCNSIYPPIYIAPGGRYRTTWPAAVLIDVELPASCTAAGVATQCWAPTPLPPGEYQLRAFATTLDNCEGECSCELDELGSCSVVEGYIHALTLDTSATWTAGCNPIVLRFD